MRRSFLVLLALSVSASGCTALTDAFGWRFGDEDAGAQHDAGAQRDAGHHETDAGQPRDGGPADGGCVATTYYADHDGDHYGDPETAVSSCDPLPDQVAEAGDCNDGNGDVHPSATETCDDVDQDCDGAIDEGLIGPIGSLITVDPDLGSGVMQARMTAHDSGTTVLWRTDSEDIIRASFYRRDGVPLAADVTIQAVGTREPSIARYTRGGIDQVVVAWMDPTKISSRLCSTAGSCGAIQTIFAGDTTSLRDLRMAQLRDRLIVGWSSSSALQLISFDPVTGDASEAVTIPPSEGMLARTGAAIATVDGSDPYSLVVRLSATIEGTTVTNSRADIVRVRGDTDLSFDPSDVVEWDASARCSALGRASCLPLVGVGGEGTVDVPSLIVSEALLASDPDGTTSTAYCSFVATPLGDGTLSTGPCMEDWNLFALRGPLATLIDEVGAAYSLREVAIRGIAAGAEPVALSEPSPTNGDALAIALSGAHGGLLATDGSAPRRLALLPLGCEP